MLVLEPSDETAPLPAGLQAKCFLTLMNEGITRYSDSDGEGINQAKIM